MTMFENHNKLLICANPASNLTWRLQQAIRDKIPQISLEIVDAIEMLPERLKLRVHNGLVTVLLAGTEDELEAALKITEFLKDTRSIIIVPNSSREVVSKGHLLAPRYLSFADGDFQDVAAVLAKMVGVVA